MNNIRSLHRWQKKVILALNDIIMIIAALWLAFALRLGQPYPHQIIVNYNYLLFIILPALGLILLNRFHLYNSILKYFNPFFYKSIILTVTFLSFTAALILVLKGLETFPRSVLPIFWALAILFLIGSRHFARVLLYPHIGTSKMLKAVAIYGAGQAGTQMLENLINSYQYRPVVFFDDHEELQGTNIKGIDVVSPKDIGAIIQDMEISMIMVAIPSVKKERRREILRYLSQFNVEVRIVPSLENLLDGRFSLEDIQRVEVEDILGREQVPADPALLERNIKNKTVLVTGAGGSIGSELCRQIMRMNPKELILLDQSEFALYQIHRELKQNRRHVPLNPVLCSITNHSRLERLFSDHKVDTVYHAAAYKHVPMVELNPLAGVYNNIIGTYRLVQAATAGKVDMFVLISTDKAVRPTNVMGATKRFAELILQAMNMAEKKTCFTMVRFGNVLDSAGSVIPLFRDQIKKGGPLTVTHREVTRYFMLIPEAVELVIQAGAIADGGEVFVLDMGSPVNIYDLAKRIISLSGNKLKDDANPTGNMEIQITGLRPGEKLYEELLIGDHTSGTRHPRIMKANERYYTLDEIEKAVDMLHIHCKNQDLIGVKEIFGRFIEGYRTVGNA